MALGFEFFAAAGDTVAAGVFLPVANLWNVSAAELGANDVQSRVAYGLLEVLANPQGPLSQVSNKLGLTNSYPNPTGVGTNLINQVYTITANYLANLANNTISPLPLPTSLVGAVNINSVFPGATKLAADVSTGGAGVHIPTALLQQYGGPAHADITVNADGRGWLAALALYIADNVNIRSNSVASAVVASNPILTVTGGLPNAAQIAASALLEENNVTQVVLTRSMSVTIQKVINTQLETIQPNHVTA